MHVSALVCAVWFIFFAFYTIKYFCGGRPVARICTCLRRLVVFGVGFLAGYRKLSPCCRSPHQSAPFGCIWGNRILTGCRNCNPVAAIRANLRRLVVPFFSEQKCTFSSHFFLKSIEFFVELCYNTFCNSHKKLIGRFLQDVTAPIFLRLFPRHSPVADVFLCN